jgi:hypothetical protein
MRLNFFTIFTLLVFASLAEAQASGSLLGNFKDPDAVREVLSGQRTVANAAWWGFDSNDATEALQSAINSGAAKVIVPYMGSDWIVKPIKLAGNQEVFFESGVVVTAKKGEFKNLNDSLFAAVGKKNVTLTGYAATLRMQKKDYITPAYKQGEWRMVIILTSCTNVNISGLKLADSGGDGLYIGESSAMPCKDITVKDCIFDNNYRQGITVVSAKNLFIENCRIENTRGAPPQAGIDLEPNHDKNELSNIVISNCLIRNNAGPGLQIYLENLSFASRNISVSIQNCHIQETGGAGILVGNVKKEGPSGLIEFEMCSVENTGAAGLFIKDKSASGVFVHFINCNWQKIALRRWRNELWAVPIYIDTTNRKYGVSGGIEFINCFVQDVQNRPVLRALQAVSNIRGDIGVDNPNGAKLDIPSECNINLELRQAKK